MFKTALKMTAAKLRFKADKMRTLNKLSLGAISDDLKGLVGIEGSKFDRGLLLVKIRISKLVNDDNTADIYEILEVDCELMLSKLNRLLSVSHDRKTGAITGGDDTVNKLARKMMFTSNYIDIKEFKKLVNLLMAKYGKVYYDDAIKTYGYADSSKSDHDFMEKCKQDDVDSLTEKYLKEFCDTYKIDLYGEGKYKEEQEEDEDDDEEDDDEDDGDEKEEEKSKDKAKPTAPSNSMDDLKKRFEALKRI